MEIDKKGILTFGEIMLRLSPPNHQRFEQTQSFELNIGGAEANVGVSLAILNHNVKYVGRIADNDIGDLVLKALKKFDVNTDAVIRGGDRTGVYYLEEGAAVRASKVVYDRKYSSFSELTPDMLDWDMLFDGIKWFHVTGITPALSQSCQEVYLEALKVAKAKGVTVSFDINYRKNLWDLDTAKKVVLETLKYTDVLFANKGVAAELFNIETTDDNSDSVQSFETIAERLAKITTAKHIAFTNRNVVSASKNSWQGILFEKGKGVCSRTYDLEIIDRIGAGDAFAAGLIHGILKDYSLQKTVDFATAASALKHSIKGDFNLATEDEVLSLITNYTPGYVKR